MTHRLDPSRRYKNLEEIRRTEIALRNLSVMTPIPLCSTTKCKAFELGMCRIVEEPVDGSKECIPEKRSRSAEY